MAEDVRAAIVVEARSWIGTPWTHQQRMKGVGVDCAGVVTETARALGLAEVDIRDYERWPDGTLLDVCRREMTEIPKGAAQAGDAVIMKFDRGPSHIGILTPYPYGGFALVHANNDAAVKRVCEHRMSREWWDRVVAALRLPGVPA